MIVLVWLCVVVSASFGLGRRLLRACGVAPAGVFEELVWSIALGMGTFGMLLFALGLTGVLYRGLILALTIVAAALSLTEVERWLARARTAARHLATTKPEQSEMLSAGRRRASLFILATLVLAGVAACAALLGALAPPTAGDALCYHLELPKMYLRQHAITYVPDSANSTYPLLMEMLFLWGLALDGGVLAQLFHWLVGLLLAGATFCLAAPVTGRRVAWLATAVVLLVPGITNQMTAPLNDLGVALYATLALAALLRGIGLVPARYDTCHSSETGWIVAAGISFGFALGIKYVALLFVPALPLLWMTTWVAGAKRSVPRWMTGSGVSLRSAAGRPALRAAALMTIVAFVVGGPWYLRAAVYTGNPVHPFLSSWFGSAEGHASASDKTPLAPTVAGLITSPWKITMHPEGFGGRAAQLGALFLAVLPGLFWVRPGRPLAVLLLAAAVYYLAWFLLRQNQRFLLPIVPVLATGVGWVIVRGVMAVETPSFRMPRLLRASVVAALGLVLLFQSLIAVARAREAAAVAVGLQSTDAFLREHEPTYAVARFASESLPDEAVILSQDYRGFYFDQRVVRENVYRRRTRYAERVKPGDEALAWLRGQGFTHALLVESAGASGIRYDRTLQDILAPRVAELPCRFRHEFVDSDGVVRTYRLLELRLPPLGAGKNAPRTAANVSQGPS